MTSPSHALPDLSISPQQPFFRFFSLPAELRSKILHSALLPTDHQPVIDLNAKNRASARQRLDIFLACRRLHEESYAVYYGGQTFRIFPTNHRFFGHRVRPLIARLPTRYRAIVKAVELRLGPGWSDPPRSWRVDGALGLEEMEAVRTVKVFVECDPSHEIFDGFRIDRDFFTGFSGGLLEDVLRRLPSVVRVELDGWPSVKRQGPLVKRLLEVARNAGVGVSEVGGNDEDDEDDEDLDISICKARRRLKYPVDLD